MQSIIYFFQHFFCFFGFFWLFLSVKMAHSDSAQITQDHESEFNLSRTLRISKLSRNVNDNHLQHIFKNYGELEKCQVKLDPKVKLSKGWGLITFKKREDAENAIKNMDQGQIDGQYVTLKFKHLELEEMDIQIR